MRLIVGIDPGDKGAVALLRDDGAFHCVWDTPHKPSEVKTRKNSFEMDMEKAADIIDSIRLVAVGLEGRVHVAIEHIHAMPIRGSIATCKLCGTYYAWLMACTVARFKITRVPPSHWKTHFGIGKGEKYRARPIAHRYYPEAELFRPDSQESVDRAEAILLARWLYENSPDK